MNALTKTENTALAISEPELMKVLQSSLYPGAAPESIKMVLGYCKAAGLDPMQKPVHIVPMWDGKAKQMRDVIMPGVGLYRTQASRTGAFAGQTEPEFGDMVTTKLGGVEITFPEWARVTVKKSMPNGSVAEFSAREYWIENYAVKGGQEKSIAPNAMWMKRPRGQIAKCAAAQALRLAFPEMGAQPTAEEMEGKTLEEGAEARPTLPADVVLPTAWPDALFAERLPDWHKAIAAKKASADSIIGKAKTKYPLSAEQEAAIRAVPKAQVVADADGVIVMTYAQVAEKLNKATNLDKLDEAASLIGAVVDTGQQGELAALFEARITELSA